LAGCLKYGLDEVPPIAERSSARETAMRVAIGSLAKSVLKRFSIALLGHVVSIGNVSAARSSTALDGLRRRVRRSPLYCADKMAADEMLALIAQAKKEGSSLGGSVEVIIAGLVPGLGSHVEWDRKLDARLSAAMMSIQSVKAVEIGDGLDTYTKKGHESHDEIILEKGRIMRRTNHAGGIEGGMSNGENIVVRVYAKPPPTSLKRLASVDMRSMTSKLSPFVRSDVCVIPAISVITEALAAWEILSLFTEKFGGDNIEHMTANYGHYVAELRRRGIH
jgi:chorismate synthase